MIKRNPFLWICRLVAAIILLQTVYQKFRGAEEAIYIFSQVDMEPYGRYATAVVELLAGLLILLPRFSLYGALLAIVLMIGAIGTHIFIIGLEVMNDQGLLFIYSVLVLLSSFIIVYAYTKKSVRTET